ncbi:MAG: hypothetical protein NMNS01_21700 [Nitrosomonas sp.]|nr:MAG: hypothetical protein NMNS01_21700 [Nitrosomonas sp.]
MSYETLLEIMENADDPQQALKEHKEKQQREKAARKAESVLERAQRKAEGKPFFTNEQIEKIQSWLSQIKEPGEDRRTVLEKCKTNPEALDYYLERANKDAQFNRRQRVNALLNKNPDKKRAYISDASTDTHNVILTVAIRGVGTFEMLIPQAKYNPWLLAEMIEKEMIH